jgi:hypothetical protein
MRFFFENQVWQADCPGRPGANADLAGNWRPGADEGVSKFHLARLPHSPQEPFS